MREIPFVLVDVFGAGPLLGNPVAVVLQAETLSAEEASSDSDIEVRTFAPAYGVPEDPVCGSGNAAIAVFRAYLQGNRYRCELHDAIYDFSFEVRPHSSKACCRALHAGQMPHASFSPGGFQHDRVERTNDSPRWG